MEIKLHAYLTQVLPCFTAGQVLTGCGGSLKQAIRRALRAAMPPKESFEHDMGLPAGLRVKLLSQEIAVKPTGSVEYQVTVEVLEVPALAPLPVKVPPKKDPPPDEPPTPEEPPDEDSPTEEPPPDPLPEEPPPPTPDPLPGPEPDGSE